MYDYATLRKIDLVCLCIDRLSGCSKTKMNHRLLSALYHQTLTSSKSIIETQVNSRNKVNNKDTKTALFLFCLKLSENPWFSDEFRENLNDVVVSLLLALNIFHTFF